MESLANHFLIAMPNLVDPNFQRTVTLICQHDQDGALGIVINRPTDFAVEEIFQQMGIDTPRSHQAHIPAYHGGPVQMERGFVLHNDSRAWDASMQIGEHMYLTSSRDILEAMARDEGPEHCLVALGYAGWASGQLEHEISENAWLNGPADPNIIFATPAEQRWNRAAELLGVDWRLLSMEAGHA
jgi:putative transcriptional regulator